MADVTRKYVDIGPGLLNTKVNFRCDIGELNDSSQDIRPVRAPGL